MTTIVIGTVNEKIICGIDQGSWDSSTGPLKRELKSSNEKKFLDFDYGITGRFLVTGNLGHQEADGSYVGKSVLEVIEDRYFPTISELFSDIEQFGIELAEWLTNHSGHNKFNDAGSNIQCRTIYVCGVNSEGKRQVGYLEYDPTRYKLSFKAIDLIFAENRTLYMGFKISPIHTVKDLASERDLGDHLLSGLPILRDSHPSFTRLHPMLISRIKAYAEQAKNLSPEELATELGATKRMKIYFELLSDLARLVSSIYGTGNDLQLLDESSGEQVKNIFASSAGSPQIRVI